MKVAVIGCGWIATSQHIPAYMNLPEAEIKYFCDIKLDRAEAAVEKNGCGIAVADYHEILKDPEVEAVSICTPNNMHSVIAIDFLKAGKHVMCEKPAARTYEEALEMQKVAHETGKVLNIGVVNRFGQGVNFIKKMIDDGDLGEVYHVYVSFRSHRSIPQLGGDFTTKAVAGGGSLIDWGIHFLDLVMYCCNDPKVTTVSGETFSKLGKDIANYSYLDMWAGDSKLDGIYDVDDSCTGLVRTDGPTISFNGAWAENIKDGGMFVDFIGTKGGCHLDYIMGTVDVYTAKHPALITYRPEFRKDTISSYQKEIADFLDCTKDGRKNRANIDEAVLTSEMMDAIYRSSEQHREIVLGK